MRTFACIFSSLLLSTAACAGAIENVKARGVVTCAVQDGSAGISELGGIKRAGLAPDLCAAIAMAVLGNPEAVAFVPVTDVDALAVLQAEEADVLFMARAWRFIDEVQEGVLLVQPLLGNEGKNQVFGPVIRQGDDAWFVALRWLLFAMANPAARQTTAEAATALGLRPDFESSSMRYEEILNRHINAIKAQGFRPAPVPIFSAAE